MVIDYAIIKYEDMNFSPKHASKIRGYFGRKYEEYSILHNHGEEKYLFTYPKVQYKVISRKPLICGINEGAKLICKLGIMEDEIIIDGNKKEIVQKKISVTKEEFGITDNYIEYEFLTPWLALNQKNNQKFHNMNDIEREDILKKILIGNIISMSKGLSYTISDNIYIWINLKEKETSLKGVKMKGFYGEFKVNFNIPDYMGLGKAVSRGFGTIKKVTQRG